MRVGDGILGPLPTRATNGASCYDVVATKIKEIEIGKVEVYLGFATEIQPGYKGSIVPRSSFTHKGWVMQNSPAQIDDDYRGEWKIKFEAIPQINAEVINYISDLGETPDTIDLSEDETMELGLRKLYPKFPYKVGERVAQIYFNAVQEVEMTIVMKGLEETDRGEGGFGSTGNKAI